MPKFFFHRLDGGFLPDEEGTECTGIQAARLEAIIYAGGTIQENPELVWAGGEMQIKVTDEEGKLVTTVIIIARDAIGVADDRRTPLAVQLLK